MKSGRFTKYICLIGTVLLCLAFLLAACGSEKGNSRTAGMTTYMDLDQPGIKIGAINGGVSGQIAAEQLPNAEIMYYNTYIDLITALENSKIDALVEDSCTLIYHNNESGGKLRMLDGFLKPFEFGYTFSKTDEGRALSAEMNGFLEKIKADGTLAKIDSNWMDPDGRREMGVDYESLPSPKGVLKLATTGTSPPFSFYMNDMVVGYDIDIISRFCEEYGYGLEVVSMTFDGIMPAVSSGKCDIGGSQISITEERKESVEFSEPYYHAGTAAGVYNPDAGGTGFISRLKESFHKTFIRESRFRLFISGILMTLMITILSAFFGTILGFLVYMSCRSGSRFANTLTKICTGIIQGLPVMVVLLILYYIAFADVPVSGAFVAVVTFTLTFASGVYAMLNSGVNAIDIGQTEAAYALGFNKHKTFFKVVLPQAMEIILPIYKGELVSLIKATAIVGYIAVQDLTRMGDIVRSRTYDAFFPLIAVAIIYFALARILILIADRLEKRIDPKRRKPEDILKGVNVHD